MAPGVKWLLKPYTSEAAAAVSVKVARSTVGALDPSVAGDLPELGLSDHLDDANVVAGVSVYAAAVYAAEQVLLDWTGMTEAETGQPLPLSREAVRAALRQLTPDGRFVFLFPFHAWLAGNRHGGIAGDKRQLRGQPLREPGSPSEDQVEVDQLATPAARLAWILAQRPDAWGRDDRGRPDGIDYAVCLDLAADQGEEDVRGLVECLAAIEAAALTAPERKEA
jgi:hypothetical protein